MSNNTNSAHFDTVVIGAGFSGLYMLHRLRDELGMSTQVYEVGDGVGGTWYWNRYPGARVDSESYVYCYSFDEDLLQEWNWIGKFPLQPEVLAYLNNVADRYDLRSNIQFNTRVTAAHFNEEDGLWEVETDYFETYNRDNVDLLDIRHFPIEEITPTGMRTADDQEHELDVIVFATGYDAMTGSFFKMDIRGRGGLELKEKWSEGPKTYLGLATVGFPNLFMITGPGSPSVLTNMPVAIEQHVEWISGFVEYLRERAIDVVDVDPEAEVEWVAHVNDLAEEGLFLLADSWYLGANIPGKPRVFMPYSGGMINYRERCNASAADGYSGFVMNKSSKSGG